MATFLASDAGSYINGTAINVDEAVAQLCNQSQIARAWESATGVLFTVERIDTHSNNYDGAKNSIISGKSPNNKNPNRIAQIIPV